MGIIIFYIVTRRYQRSKMKLYMLIAVAALLFVGYVRAEEEEIDVTDLAEEDFSQIKKGRHRVNHLVYLAVKYRHQYRVCHHRYPKIVKHCHRRLHHFKRVYHHLKHRVHRARRVLRSWLHKYRHCVKFCWWRRGGKHKGDVKEDFFGLGRAIHHVGHGILGVGHHAVNLFAGVLGDNKLDAQDKDALIASINKVLADDKLTTEQKEDFLHMIIHGIGTLAHGILGDNKLDAQDKTAILANINKILADDKLTTEQKEDFLRMIFHSLGRILGDNKLDAHNYKDFIAALNKKMQ